MDNVTIVSSIFNNTNIACPTSLLWDQASVDSRKPRLCVCIIAVVIHSIFWLQLVFCSSLRQKSIQWIYAYLITDLLLLFRFFITYTIHTKTTECVPSIAWALFACYFEATVDNYLNVLRVWILLALNICRYIQIAYNRNVYRVHTKALILTYLGIYLISLLFFLIRFLFGWSQLNRFGSDRCVVSYTNLPIQVFNVILTFALPIILNLLMIYASVRHVRLTSHLRRTRHHVSAREKYNRSLVIQFLVFYIIWVTLWSPNVIVYQVSPGANGLLNTVRLLNFIEIALDPIIIAALDVRFWHAWRKGWMHVKNNILYIRPNQARIRPATTNLNVFSVKTPRLQTTAF
jgi:hypothetical protein